MNERIKELAEQAGFMPNNFISRWDAEFVLFAELLIEECAEIAKHHVMNISTYRDAEFVDEQIKQHFDAEEYNPNLKDKNT